MPQLSALRPARVVSGFSVTFVNDIREGRGHSVIIADHASGAPAWEVWPDNSRVPQQLPAESAHATSVLQLDDGLLTVSWNESRVQLSGPTAWKRTGLLSPYSAVVWGTSVFVTEYGAGQVSELCVHTGAVLRVHGKAVLKQPLGIAANANGEFFVAEYQDKCVQVCLLYIFMGLCVFMCNCAFCHHF